MKWSMVNLHRSLFDSLKTYFIEQEPESINCDALQSYKTWFVKDSYGFDEHKATFPKINSMVVYADGAKYRKFGVQAINFGGLISSTIVSTIIYTQELCEFIQRFILS